MASGWWALVATSHTVTGAFGYRTPSDDMTAVGDIDLCVIGTPLDSAVCDEPCKAPDGAYG